MVEDQLSKANLDIIKVMVKCRICENVWGINVEDRDIPFSRLICNSCRRNITLENGAKNEKNYQRE